MHFAFEIHFKLIDGSKVEECTGLNDKKGEGEKVFRFLKNALPKNITYSGNITKNNRHNK